MEEAPGARRSLGHAPARGARRTAARGCRLGRTRRAPPGRGARTSTRSCRSLGPAEEERNPATPGRGAGHRGAGSLVGEVGIAEPCPSCVPISIGDGIEQRGPEPIDATWHEHDRVTDIEIAHLATLVEAPSMSSGCREAHLPTGRHLQIAGPRHARQHTRRSGFMPCIDGSSGAGACARSRAASPSVRDARSCSAHRLEVLPLVDAAGARPKVGPEVRRTGRSGPRRRRTAS